MPYSLIERSKAAFALAIRVRSVASQRRSVEFVYLYAPTPALTPSLHARLTVFHWPNHVYITLLRLSVGITQKVEQVAVHEFHSDDQRLVSQKRGSRSRT